MLFFQFFLLLGRFSHLLQCSNRQRCVSTSRFWSMWQHQQQTRTYPEDVIQAGHLLLELSYFALSRLALAFHRAQWTTKRHTFRFKLATPTKKKLLNHFSNVLVWLPPLHAGGKITHRLTLNFQLLVKKEKQQQKIKFENNKRVYPFKLSFLRSPSHTHTQKEGGEREREREGSIDLSGTRRRYLV